MARRATARRAMTLLELTAVVVIIGLLGRDGGHALRLDDDGRRRCARVSPGDWHSIARRPGGGRSPPATTTCCDSRLSGGKATQYALYRRQGASTTLVDEVHAVPASVTVTTGGTTDVEFTFTGEALGVVHDHGSGARTARGPSRCRRSPARRSCSRAGGMPSHSRTRRACHPIVNRPNRYVGTSRFL